MVVYVIIGIFDTQEKAADACALFMADDLNWFDAVRSDPSALRWENGFEAVLSVQMWEVK